VKLLAERFHVYLGGLRASRAVAEQHAETDSEDMLTLVITEFEKNAWFLRASLEG
jgi:starvation-inducible DNA-binding protein